MTFADVLTNLAIPAGGTGIVVLLIIVAYRLITDRSAVMAEVTTLKEQVRNLGNKVAHLEEQYDEQRSLKHKALNDVARCVLVLDLVQRLSKDCDCESFQPVAEIVDRLMIELQTMPNRQLGQLPERGTS